MRRGDGCIAIDLDRPAAKNWRKIIPQAEATLVAMSFVGDRFIASYLQDVRPLVKVFSGSGRFLRDVELPGIGAVTGFRGKRTDNETFYTFSSFATPPSLYHYNVASGASSLFRRAEGKFNPDNFQVRQVFYTSKDGTRRSMFIAARRGSCWTARTRRVLRLRGLQYRAAAGLRHQPGGVDGNGRRLRPAQPPRRRRIRRGLAQGGHEAAQAKRLRQLHRRRRVAHRPKVHPPRPPRHPRGQQRRPVDRRVMTHADLFGACLPAVGVMDMLRFQKFTEGRTWVDDYGSAADSPEQFRACLRIPPITTSSRALAIRRR